MHWSQLRKECWHDVRFLRCSKRSDAPSGPSERTSIFSFHTLAQRTRNAAHRRSERRLLSPTYTHPLPLSGSSRDCSEVMITYHIWLSRKNRCYRENSRGNTNTRHPHMQRGLRSIPRHSIALTGIGIFSSHVRRCWTHSSTCVPRFISTLLNHRRERTAVLQRLGTEAIEALSNQ